MTRALILAAGKGSRLVQGRPYPKPLEEVEGVPLIVRVLGSLARAGIDEVGIVIGHLGEVLRSELEARTDIEAELSFFWNDEVEKPNGTSLLKAAEFVQGPTYLLMSDHLWAPSLVRKVSRFPLAHDESVLAVDRDVPGCFDLPDATKVRVKGDRVVEIGKELPSYDCLDTGVFRITPALVQALRDAETVDGCSLSQGVGTLAAQGKMRVVDVTGSSWIDVDTPDAHAEAERRIRRYGDDLTPTLPAAAAARTAALPA